MKALRTLEARLRAGACAALLLGALAGCADAREGEAELALQNSCGAEGATLIDAAVATVDGGAHETVEPALPDAGPQPDERDPAASIRSAVALGSGCPTGTASIALSPASDSVDVAFASFAFETTSARTRGTTDCTLNLDVAVPAGHTLAIERVTLRGAASLPAGTTARITAVYNYLGVPGTSATKLHPVVGPYDAPFTATAEFAGAERLFRACDDRDATLNLNVYLNVRADDPTQTARASLQGLADVRFALRPCD